MAAACQVSSRSEVLKASARAKLRNPPLTKQQGHRGIRGLHRRRLGFSAVSKTSSNSTTASPRSVVELAKDWRPIASWRTTLQALLLVADIKDTFWSAEWRRHRT